MSIIRFTQSTFLAARSIDAKDLGPAGPPKAVALPGAKAALDHGYLLAHQAQGRDQHTIVQRLNAKWERDNEERLAEHKRWVAGPYAGAMEEMRRKEMEAAAEDLRRRARLEQLLAGED